MDDNTRENIYNNENNTETVKFVSGSAPKNDGSDLRMELYDWVQCFVSALVVGILIFIFLFRVITVDGNSMNPTLFNGDKIIISKLFYTPKYGDIIVLRAENFSSDPLVKRVIATEGQTISIDFSQGVVYIDGEPLDEEYTAAPTFSQEDFREPLTVPEGCVFVMGDNRNASTDSRTSSIGMIDSREIFGKVYLIIFPGKDASDSRDWHRLGGVK